MPQEIVAGEVAAGRLRQLQLAEGARHHYPISLVHQLDAPPGPAGRWLMKRRLAETESKMSFNGGGWP